MKGSFPKREKRHFTPYMGMPCHYKVNRLCFWKSVFRICVYVHISEQFFFLYMISEFDIGIVKSIFGLHSLRFGKELFRDIMCKKI